MNATISLNQINDLFNKELNELWRRYKNENKKPEYFPYNVKADSPSQLLEYGLGQMIEALNFVEAIYHNDPLQNDLSFSQWMVYEWFTKSLKGDEQNILLKVKSL